MKKSCILFLKGENISDIICNFLKNYSIRHKLDYKILDLNLLNKYQNDVFEDCLIEYIEKYIKNYKNVLIYYIGNGYYNNNEIIFPLSKFNNNIIDHYEIMEYFVSYWNKKIIYICDCDNIKDYEIKKKFYDGYLNYFEKCNIKTNIFNTINSPIIISSCPDENYSGLLTLNLFNNLNKNIETKIDIIKKNTNIVYDIYDKIPISCIDDANINGFETTENGNIIKFNVNNKYR